MKAIQQVSAPALFDRLTSARALPDHRLQLLRDSAEHEAATMDLVLGARHHILIEHYRVESDDWGQTLLLALCDKARAGVEVRLLVDWLGSVGRIGRYWQQQLQQAGVILRYFNPPSLTEPLGWIIRNHRKLISVDGCEAIITGWCLSAEWRGDTHSGPWRDTGVRVAGKIVRQAEAAFAETWQLAGGDPLREDATAWPACPLSHQEQTSEQAQVRLLVGRPQSSPLLRLDLSLISLAQERIWLTDAYPVGTPIYLQALREAAHHGVDVRLLVPGSSDLPLLGLLARSSYRALLDAGVRVYEWNGAMLHAKTAVIDGYWSRIGSSNLNPASWIGNYELDLVIEDQTFARVMEDQYLADLEQATEVVQGHNRKVTLVEPRPRQRRRQRPHQSSVTTLRVSRAMVMAVRESRPLSPTDASLLGLLGLSGLIIAGLSFWQPAWLAWPFGVASAWVSIHLLRLAWRRWREHRRSRT